MAERSFFKVGDLKMEWSSSGDRRPTTTLTVTGPFVALLFDRRPRFSHAVADLLAAVPEGQEARERFADGTPSVLLGTCEPGALAEEKRWVALMPTKPAWDRVRYG